MKNSLNIEICTFVGTENLSWLKEKEEIEMEWKLHNIMYGGI